MLKSLSIIIPAYNEERHVKSCLDAIAAQTEPPDEVIVVDNNSTDGTAAIAARYPFVRIVRAKPQGIVHARDAGFNAATGDILGRIDADTRLPSDWTARVRRFYNTPGHDRSALTGGGYFYNIHFHRFNGWMQSQFAYRLNRLVVGYYVLWGSNMALPRAAWQTVRQDVCLRQDIHEDLDLAIHLHRRGYSIAYDGTLRVGVVLKRVLSDRVKLKAHMRRWPQSLKVHGYPRWWIGVVGNQLLWFLVQPPLYAAEMVARLFSKADK